MQHLDWKLLTAFEAAARHGSFSHAAAELNVLQPAISRRVARLEESLGVRLLERTRPSARLTTEGQVLFRAVSSSMAQVQTALSHIATARDDGTLVVNTTIGFASCFLMQRLNDFRAQFPAISIELVSRDLNDGFRHESSDIVTVFDSPSRLPGVAHKRIFPETMIAVCTPAYLAENTFNQEDLHRQLLLHLPVGNHRSDWQKFLNSMGQPMHAPEASQRYTSFMVYLQAALNGDGIAIGWAHLLDDLLASGQLVKAVDHAYDSDRGYFCCITDRARSNKAAQTFMDWCETLVSGP